MAVPVRSRLRHAPTIQEARPSIKDTGFGEADLARMRHGLSADQPGVADRVVRGTERALNDQRLAAVEHAGDAVDAGHVGRFVQGQERHDRWQSPCDERLARSRRPDQEQVVYGLTPGLPVARFRPAPG